MVSKQQHSLPTSNVFSVLPDNNVMRVFQLDALAIQDSLGETLRTSFFQIFQTGPLAQLRFAYQEELTLFVDGLLYYLSMWRSGQSVGDRLQNLVVRDEVRARAFGLQSSVSLVPSLAPHRRLLLIHAVLSLLVPYVARKFQRKVLDEGWSREDPRSTKYRVAKIFKYVCVSWALLSLANTLHFLSTGQYRSLLERLLSLKMVYGSQKMIRLTNIMYFNQHMWISTWTSLLTVLNVGRYFRRLVRSVKFFASPRAVLTDSENVCSVCHETPVISQRSNCGHVYCYYCIKSRLLDSQSSGSFRCFRCGQSVHTCGPA